MAKTTCPLRRSYGAGEGRAAAASDLPGPAPNPPRAAQAAPAFPSTALLEGCACPPAAPAMSKRLCNVTERETRILRSQPARPRGLWGRRVTRAEPPRGLPRERQPASQPARPSWPVLLLPGSCAEPWAVSCEPCWAVLSRAEPCPVPTPAPLGACRHRAPPAEHRITERPQLEGIRTRQRVRPLSLNRTSPRITPCAWERCPNASVVLVQRGSGKSGAGQARIGCCSWNTRGRQSTVAEISSAAGGKR